MTTNRNKTISNLIVNVNVSVKSIVRTKNVIVRILAHVLARSVINRTVKSKPVQIINR